MTLSPGVGTWSDAWDGHQRESDASVVEKSWETPDVFAVLFDRYADDIHRYVARRLGVDAADDLMAETFVIAFQRRRRYDLTQTQARPWLYGIATNLVGRHRRVEARRLRALSRAAAYGGDTEGEPMEDRIAERDSAERAARVLAGALAELPARHRDVLLLVAWGGLDYTETARSLGIPVGTVRSRLHRARAQLRKSSGSMDTQDALRATAPPKEHDHG
ncbi:RNA polymerase sigma factor [Streptomyces adustus]|uniref:RNA polymerase sigma factor n=1 Tax=Streptomyces adustus TaxID=1609272 RepID=UPI00372276E9